MPTETVAPALPKNFLRSCVLLLLREGPAHGYQLLKSLQPLGHRAHDPGGLYRVLRALEKELLVRSAWERSERGPDRRIYEITRLGMLELYSSAKGMKDGVQMLDRFLVRYGEFVALDKRGSEAWTEASPVPGK